MMCLNQILRNEQIALMRVVGATSAAERVRHRRDLGRFGEQLAAHPYPHRPYAPQIVPTGKPEVAVLLATVTLEEGNH